MSVETNLAVSEEIERSEAGIPAAHLLLQANTDGCPHRLLQQFVLSLRRAAQAHPAITGKGAALDGHIHPGDALLAVMAVESDLRARMVNV